MNGQLSDHPHLMQYARTSIPFWSCSNRTFGFTAYLCYEITKLSSRSTGEDAEYTGHSLTMLERIAAVCGVALKLHAERKSNFDREVTLV